MVKERPSPRILAERRHIGIGAAVNVSVLRDDVLYHELLARELNVVTAETAVKFGSLSARRDVDDFSDADTLVDFSEAHGMRVRGRTLAWHRNLPRWLLDGAWGRDELLDMLRQHIRAVVGRYHGMRTIDPNRSTSDARRPHSSVH